MLQISNLVGFMTLSGEILQPKKKVDLRWILWRQGLGWNFNLQAISSSGRKWGRRTSDEKIAGHL
jgi:hypothetical protein